MSRLFLLGDQNIGALASVSFLPVSIQGWFPVGLTGLISLLSKGLSRVFSSTTIRKHQSFGAYVSLWSSSHSCMWVLEKTIPLTIQIFADKMMALTFNTVCGFVIAFLPRGRCLIISWLQSTVHSNFQFSSGLFATPWTAPHQATLFITNSRSSA